MKAKPIYLVGGSKGGTGKTMVSLALLDYLRDKGPVLLIETDNSNPDVSKTYASKVKSEAINLDNKAGWLTLVDCIDANKDHVIVINGAARSSTSVNTHGPILNERLGERGRKLVTLWVINRQRDSLNLLVEYLKVMTNSETHVVQNGHWGPVEAFSLYRGSNLRASIEAAGGKSLFFPNLADRVADEIYSKRLQIEDAQQKMTIGNRAELQRFRAIAATMFKEIVR